MQYTISYKLKVKGKNRNIYVKKVKIEDLYTNQSEKLESPQWLFSKKLNDNTNPTDLGGFVIDWDHKDEPILNKNYEYYLHQTHGMRWRVIVPFDKTYKFTDAMDYKNAYLQMLNIVFSQCTQSVEELIAKKYIDKNFFSPNFFAIMRPKNNELFYNEGEKYEPGFKSKSDVELKRDIILKGSAKVYEDVAECQYMLARMIRFFDYYKCSLNWKWITQKALSSCIFGGELHDKKEGDIYYNNPVGSSMGHIKCMHGKCLEGLLEKLAPFQNMKKTTTNYTVLHLTYGIISGKYSLEQIEACALHRYKKVLENLSNLFYMRFDPKIDSPVWLKILHENILLHPLSLNVYEYTQGYYRQIQPPILLAKYHDSAGTYMGYRTGHKRTKIYVADTIEYMRGTMLTNYKDVIECDGLSLENGLIHLRPDGEHDFTMSSPTYFYTHKMDYKYDPNASCKCWKKILIDYFDDLKSPQVQCLQEYIGYILMNSRKYEKLLTVFGIPRSGKNTVIQTLMSLVPSISLNASQVCNYRERQTIVDKRLVFINEFSVSSRESTLQELKKISSTDPITIRALYSAEFQLTTVPKLIIGFNRNPEKFSMDKGLGARMIAIKFTRSFFHNIDVDLKDRLLEERPGILNWALKGYRRLIRNNKFTVWEEDTQELYEATASDSDVALEEFIDKKFKEKIRWGATELYNAYVEETGDRFTDIIAFAKKLTFTSVTRKRTSTGSIYVKWLN